MFFRPGYAFTASGTGWLSTPDREYFRQAMNADGVMTGVEAVIDKDRTSALLAVGLGADAILLLTDVAAVFRDWGTDEQLEIGRTTPDALERLDFAPGSMGPKVSAAATLVREGGKSAGIG